MINTINKKNVFILTVVTGISLLLTGIYWLRNREIADEGVSVTVSDVISGTNKATSTNDIPVLSVERIANPPSEGFYTEGHVEATEENIATINEQLAKAALNPQPDVLEEVNSDLNVDESNSIDSSLDSDSDSIPDTEEARYGTDPNKADTDGDGFNDADEIKNGYNPLGEGRCAVSTCIINE
ncbi:MAG: hypothetical protein KC582_03005 [Candidatus Magasanikbacteria bacterium]|nr:hypothetical protein [Candidatus Magasanikbacteria bacterium]